jgi:hypothetical protein
MRVPSGLKATELTRFRCPVMTAKSSPLPKSQTRTVLSG